VNEIKQENLRVVRRDGSVVSFDRQRIAKAIASAFLRDANGAPRHQAGDELMPSERAKVERFTDQVVAAVSRRPDAGEHPVCIEDIQDQVELALMRDGEHAIASGAREAVWMDVDLARSGSHHTNFRGRYCLGPNEPHFNDAKFYSKVEHRMLMLGR
jgi:hypothetical protein